MQNLKSIFLLLIYAHKGLNMNNFTGNIFDENGDYIMEATILDNFEETEEFEEAEQSEMIICDFDETYVFNKSEIYILDCGSKNEICFDDVQDDEIDCYANNFIERNISLIDYINEDVEDFNMLHLALTNKEIQIKKRKRLLLD